eukprot:3697925-Prymnesium_polylepis.1
MQAIAEADAPRSWPNAIVAHIDLSLGAEACAKSIAAHKAAGANLRGIRDNLSWVPDKAISLCAAKEEHMSRLPAFRAAFALLASAGLSYDAWLYHEQLPDLTDLAAAFPGTTIICDHVGQPLGKAPYEPAQVFPVWQERMRMLAQHKNVYVKLSGLGMAGVGLGFDERP